MLFYGFVTSLTRAQTGPALRAAVGISGLAAALGLRVLVAGDAGARSLPAGAVFACALGLVAVALGVRWPAMTRRRLAAGVLGGAFLCLPPFARHLAGTGIAGSWHGYAGWLPVVALVAVAEETVLRGGLFDALDELSGTTVAVVATSVAFALLHVPLYGWHVVPLDVAVGLWLAALRVASGTFVVPATAHAFADAAGWWLR